MIPVNSSTLGRYAAHVSLVHTMKSHKAPALTVMMIFSDLLIRSTEDSYRLQGWEITPQKAAWCCVRMSRTILMAESLKSPQKTILHVITGSCRCSAPFSGGHAGTARWRIRK